MKNKYLLMVVFVLSIIAVLSSQNNKTTFLNDQEDISLLNPEDNTIAKMNLEDYVVGVVAAEMPALFQEEALKAQAVAARAYALYKMQHTQENYDVIADISNQAYLTKEEMQDKWQQDYDKYYAKIKKAVEDTNSQVMTYNDQVIIAYYFAMSNGKTEDASIVFGEKEDYLESVDSFWDKNVDNFVVTNTIAKEEFCTQLNLDCTNIRIGEITRSNTNRVNKIVINDEEFKGTTIRSKLNLRSTDFDIEVTDKGINITTRGYGHGVGMSQYGANEMAKLGFTYEEILKYYYKNVNLTKNVV